MAAVDCHGFLRWIDDVFNIFGGSAAFVTARAAAVGIDNGECACNGFITDDACGNGNVAMVSCKIIRRKRVALTPDGALEIAEIDEIRNG